MKQTDKKPGKLNAFISSKGFYVALAVCLMASGVASWMAVENSVQDMDLTPQSSQTASDEQVNRPQSSVEKPSSSQSSSITPPSSSDSSSSETQTSSASTSSSQSQAATGLFILPASGEIFNTFSGGELVRSKTMGDWRTHDGIDIDCESDPQVKAAGAGVVTSVKDDPLWGTCIEITHDGGIVTYYYSLASETAVTKGQKVEAGDVIGTASDSAAVEVLEPIHVHFAAKRDGEWIDPTTLISAEK